VPADPARAQPARLFVMTQPIRQEWIDDVVFTARTTSAHLKRRPNFGRTGPLWLNISADSSRVSIVVSTTISFRREGFDDW
jgi:hypothetical protein